MNSFQRTKSVAIILVALLNMLALFGCSQNQHWSPTGPISNETITSLSKDDDDDGDDDDFDFLMVARRDPAENGVTTALIGPAGGVITHADHRIEIPAGALSETIEISFSMPVSDTLIFDLGPHGTQFSMPINMVLEFEYDNAILTGVNEAGLRVAYYNESTGEWELMPTTVDTVNDVVTGQTTHFSRYAIIRT